MIVFIIQETGSNIAKRCLMILMIAAVFIKCGYRRPIIEVGSYSFLFKGKTYSIESMTPNYLEGYNLLLLSEEDIIVLKAIDKEQDGKLDKVEIGDISLEYANEIYRAGIAEGEKLGYIKKRTFAREYRTFIDQNNYILSTYLLAVGEVYNRLILIRKEMFPVEEVIFDIGADGVLDRVERGTENLGYYQNYYREVIKKGLNEGRVRKTDGMYIVIL